MSDHAVEAIQDWKLGKWFPKLNGPKLEKLWAFRSELLRFSKAINLVSTKTLPELDVVHFGDSIMGCELIVNATQHKRIFDIGAGNGFPGIVLAILHPEREVVLVETDGRKCEFLKHVISHLRLTNASVVNESVQSLPVSAIECGVSRGFADIPRSLLTLNRVMGQGAVYFHFKGEEWASEVANMPSQLFSLWEPSLVDNYVVPGDKRKLSIIKTVKLRS